MPLFESKTLPESFLTELQRKKYPRWEWYWFGNLFQVPMTLQGTYGTCNRCLCEEHPEVVVLCTFILLT
ncbi:unnamed protein product [Calypogeia fissa]